MMAAIVYVVFFSVMNVTSFNVVVPLIANQFHLSIPVVSWVVVGYNIVLSIGSGTYGKLSDLFSIRKLFVFGVCLFFIGSLVGSISQMFWMVIISRIVQASGAAAIPALSYIIVSKYLDAESRGSALRILAAGVAFATGVGPIFSGFFAEFFGWHSVFLFSALAVAGVPFLLRLLPQTSVVQHAKFDVPGFVMFSLGIASLLIGLHTGWLVLVASAILLVAYFGYSVRAKTSFVDIRMFRNRPYVLLLLQGFTIFFCNASALFVLPLLLTHVQHLSTGLIGLIVFPGSMIAVLITPQLGRLSSRFGNEFVLIAAAFAMGMSFVLLSSFGNHAILTISALWIMTSIGFASTQASLAEHIARTLTPQTVGIGMGLFTMANILGSAFGPSITSFILAVHSRPWNPVAAETLGVFSNAYLFIAAISIASVLLVISARRLMAHKVDSTVS